MVLARYRRPRRDAGFSLIEVLIATGLLVVGVVGVAQLFIVSTKANTASRASTFSTVLAQQKMEQLRELTWGFDANGSAVTDTQTNLAVTPPTASGGVGLSASPASAVYQSTTGYVDYLDSAGNWVGTGTSPVAGTIYVRRWSITPLPEDPSNTLVLQVLVSRVRTRGTSNPGARLPDEARLMSLKTRKFL